jgi:hypothetical protein
LQILLCISITDGRQHVINDFRTPGVNCEVGTYSIVDDRISSCNIECGRQSCVIFFAVVQKCLVRFNICDR